VKKRVLLVAMACAFGLSDAVLAKEVTPKKKKPAPVVEPAPEPAPAPAPPRRKAISPLDMQKAEEDVPEPPKKPKPAEKKPEVKVKAGASLQTDYRSHSYPEGTPFTRDDHVANYDMRRSRVEVRGEIGEYYSAKLSVDFSNGAELKDAYINYNFFEPIQVLVGQEDTPFGTEALGSTMNQEFLEKSMMGKLTDNGNDRGMMFHGEMFDSIFSYHLGFLTGASGAVHDNNNSSDFATRMVLGTPKDFDSFFHGWIGFSYMAGSQNTTTSGDSIKIVTEAGTGGATLFQAKLPAALDSTTGKLSDAALLHQDYDRSRFGVEMTALLGPVTTKFEYFTTTYDFGNPVTINGGYVFGSWMLTGETRTVSNGVLESQKVEDPFEPDFSGLGAWEVAFRYSWYTADANFFADNGLYNGWTGISKTKNADAASAFTVGVNWYPEQKVRIMFNWINTLAADPNSTSTSKTSVEQAIMFRFQLGI